METSSIEVHIVEVHAIVDILLFVAEAPDDDRARLRPSAIALLYIAGDKLDQAEKALEAAH